jgi:osmoprotectant transport system substrate-binding protein
MIRSRQSGFIAALAAMGALLAACGGGGSNSSGSATGALTIATKDFTENRVMGVMAKKLLEKKGFTVKLTEISGNAAIRTGLTSAQYDGYYEYIGTAEADVFHLTQFVSDPVAAVAKLNELDASNKVQWLPAAAKFEDADVLLVKDTAKYGDTMTKLAAYEKGHPDTLWCIQQEFKSRPIGMPLLQSAYGLVVPDQKINPLKEALAVKSLASADSGRCEVAQGFSTDANIKVLGLTIVKDDKAVTPSQSFAPAFLKATVDKYPSIKDALQPIVDNFTTDDSIQMQKDIDVDHKNIDTVVEAYLKAKGAL